MRIAILQPNYIPWKGYFDLIDSVDCFVLLDTVQYTDRDWRNRNRIKTSGGVKWLTIPMSKSSDFRSRLIRDARIAETDWKERHWNTIAENYRAAPRFSIVSPWAEELYRTCQSDRLSEIDEHFIRGICGYLGIKTTIVTASELEIRETERTERLLSICRYLAADEYVSGPTAKAYLDESRFDLEGIKLSYFSYQGFPEYEQVHPPFVHQVTVIDAILHLGEDATEFVLRQKGGL